MYFMNYKKITGTQFIPELSSCILGVYNNSRIIETVMLLVKMYKLHCKYNRNVLSRVVLLRDL